MKLKHKGFTLIELIVVMAIIAILVLLAMPMFNGYTQKAKVTRIINDIKVTETSAELYYMEKGEWPKYPTAYTAPQINDKVSKFYGRTGQQATLDPAGIYYKVDYTKLYPKMQKPTNNDKFIVQNPVGDIYYIGELTPLGVTSGEFGPNVTNPFTGNTGSFVINVESNPYYAGNKVTAVIDKGDLWVVGDNSCGQLGEDVAGGSSYTPVQIPHDKDVVSVQVGNGQTIFIDTTGSAYAMGCNDKGQLGISTNLGTTVPVTTPVKIFPTESIITSTGNDTLYATTIQTGPNGTAIIDSDNNLWTFGLNQYGQLGTSTNFGTTVPVSTPTLVEGVKVSEVALGRDHTIIVNTDGNLYSVGSNQYGQLGTNTNYGTTTGTYTLTPTLPGVKVENVAAQNCHTLVIDETGKLWSWGSNVYGELGHTTGLGTSYQTPVNILPGQTFTYVSASLTHSLAVDSAGRLYSFGLNNYGQLGHNTNIGTMTPNATPVHVLTDKTIKYAYAGNGYSVVVDTDGKVYTFGLNQSGQLGTVTNYNTTNYSSTPQTWVYSSGVNVKPVAVITMTPTTNIFTNTIINWSTTSSTDPNGDLISNVEWEGKQDIYTTAGSYTVRLRVQDNKGLWSDWVEKTFTVVNFVGVTNIKQIAVAQTHTVALMNDGTVMSWGTNPAGQLGIAANSGTWTANPIPTTIPGLTGVKKVFASDYNTFALMDNGTIKAWGSNYAGQLTSTTNNGNNNPNTTPRQLAGLANVKDISAGVYQVFAVLNDGTVKSWGWNAYGQLGTATNSGTNNPNINPTTIPGLTGVKEIAAGDKYTVALLNDGTVKAWGNNQYGQLGIAANSGNTINANINPTTVPGLTDVKKIIAGEAHTLALMNDGTVKSWGWNKYGQLGIATNSGTDNPNSTPTVISELSGVNQIVEGDRYSFAIMNDGTVKSWGWNAMGQLGDGTIIDKSTPVTVPGLTNVKEIIAGETATLALMNDGSLKGWGWNHYGQLADIGTIGQVTTPTVIPGLNN